jgi:hypothetical protein
LIRRSTIIREEKGERQGLYQGGGTVNDIAVPQGVLGFIAKLQLQKESKL